MADNKKISAEKEVSSRKFSYITDFEQKPHARANERLASYEPMPSVLAHFS